MQSTWGRSFLRNATTRDGFTLVEIIIVVGVIGLLAVIAVPNFLKSRTQAQTNACINNLRQIDNAKEQLAMEAKLETGSSVTVSSVNTFIKGGTTLSCLAGGSYTYHNIGTNPVCNISGHVYSNGGSSDDSGSGGGSSSTTTSTTTSTIRTGPPGGKPFM